MIDVYPQTFELRGLTSESMKADRPTVRFNSNQYVAGALTAITGPGHGRPKTWRKLRCYFVTIYLPIAALPA